MELLIYNSFYYTSIRLLSLWWAFSECFFYIGSALSLCVVLQLSNIILGGSEAKVVRRNTGWKQDNKKNFKNHIISSIIKSKDFFINKNM